MKLVFLLGGNDGHSDCLLTFFVSSLRQTGSSWMVAMAVCLGAPGASGVFEFSKIQTVNSVCVSHQLLEKATENHMTSLLKNSNQTGHWVTPKNTVSPTPFQEKKEKTPGLHLSKPKKHQNPPVHGRLPSVSSPRAPQGRLLRGQGRAQGPTHLASTALAPGTCGACGAGEGWSVVGAFWKGKPTGFPLI